MPPRSKTEDVQSARCWADYEQRLERVTAHIYEHLAEPLDLNALADVAHLSPYHWHRVYHAMRGETVAATVKRLRLQAAARWLAQTDWSVADIARRSGYTSAASFTRLFKEAHGMPPAQFRSHGEHVRFSSKTAHEQPQRESELKVRVLAQPSLRLACMAHRGAYINIGQAFERLFMQLGKQQLMHEGQRTLGVYFDDPAMVSASALRSCAAVTLAPQGKAAPPLQEMVLAAGRYAVLRYQGPYSAMHAAYRWLYGQWLPNSGFEPANAPVYEDYLNNPREVLPSALLTDIYLPLQ
jgi:AraC family transcriptional regulator